MILGVEKYIQFESKEIRIGLVQFSHDSHGDTGLGASIISMMIDYVNPLIRGDSYLWGLNFLHDLPRYHIQLRDWCRMGEVRCMIEATKKVGFLFAATFLTACGEPAFENAGSQASLLEDREACAAEIDKSSAANAYRQNPDAHPQYPMKVFNEMNRCIERKGWKQVRSQQEQEQLRDAIAEEVIQK